MKKFILLFIATLSFAIDTKEILKEINILENIDFRYKEITNIYNPFISNKKRKNSSINIPLVTESKKGVYNLEVIFQNKVRINNNWYKNGDKLDEYIIIIRNNKVYLKNKNKLIKLNRESLIKVQ